MIEFAQKFLSTLHRSTFGLALPTLGLTIGIGLLVELFGRRFATSEWHDFGTVAILMTYAGILSAVHARRKPSWIRTVQETARKTYEWIRDQKIEVGIDLR